MARDDDKEVRIAFALVSYNSKAIGHVTTRGIAVGNVQDLMVVTIEHRYSQANRVPEPIERRTDIGCLRQDAVDAGISSRQRHALDTVQEFKGVRRAFAQADPVGARMQPGALQCSKRDRHAGRHGPVRLVSYRTGSRSKKIVSQANEANPPHTGYDGRRSVSPQYKRKGRPVARPPFRNTGSEEPVITWLRLHPHPDRT